MKTSPLNKIVFLATLMVATAAFGQLQWSSYNNVGTLVTSNVASGGDATYGGSVTFTIPASTQLAFLTKTFAPFTIATANQLKTITFTITESGGGLVPTSGRLIGFGVYNDTGTVSQDSGYFGLFNKGTPGWEAFQRPTTSTTFFQFVTADKFNAGTTKTGVPVDGTAYSGQIQVVNKAGAIQLGTSGSVLANAGLGLTGSGVTQIGDGTTISGTDPAINQTSFNEFGVMFNNTTASSVTLTLSGINLVPLNPVFATQPNPVSGSPGTNATFTITLNANTDLASASYQWYSVAGGTTNIVSNGATINGSTNFGATTASLTISNAQTGDNANYFIVVSNAYGIATSSQATLNISSADTAPTISAIAPPSSVVVSGNNTNITVTASGSPTPVYYWYDNNTNLFYSSSSGTLTLTNLQLANAGTYSVVASNRAGFVSTNFTVNVVVLPVIVSQPSSLLLNLGDPANFSVTSTNGVPTPAYQWLKNGAVIPGATATNYSIGSVAYSDIATYSVTISNTAGKITSSNAVLAINSTMSVTAESPTNGATGICYDTPLALTFNQPVLVGSTGKVRIYNATNSTTPVDTLDLSQGSPQPRTIGGVNISAYPIITSGNVAAIYPHSGVMTSNQTYYVTVDSGVVIDTNNASFTGISDTNAWRFTTKPAGPTNSASMFVAADGSGDFATVQGAIDAVPNNNNSHVTINIRNGLYTEINRLNSKSNVTFLGQDRHQTIIAYANFNGINGSSSTRPMFGVLGASDVTFENLTMTNSTPNGTGNNQAETLYVNVSRRVIVLSVDLDSYQDTLLVNANGDQTYVKDCHIQGNTDYIWGQGTLYVTNSELMYMTPQSGNDYLTQARTPVNTNGFAFVNCLLDRNNAGVTNCFLGRDASGSGFPFGQVAYINCQMDTNAVVPAGWALGSGTTVGGGGTGTASLRLWEYQSVDLNSNPVNTNSRASWSTQITGSQAASVQDVTNWFGGWLPQLAPVIVTNPVAQSASAGSAVSFNVGAIGVPSPSYQWIKDGTNLPGATSATYSIGSAHRTDSGNYSVIVSNGSGSVTSSVVALTYTGNTAPVANTANFSRGNGLGLKILISDLLTNATDADGDAIVLTGVASTTAGVTLTTNSTFVFYTATNDAPDTFSYSVADAFGGSNTGTVSITSVGSTGTQNTTISVTSNSADVSFFGIPGDSYHVQRSTNLTDWTTLDQVTADGFGSISYSDTNTTGLSTAYYRLISP